MRIDFSKGVYLNVDITEQMKYDYRNCQDRIANKLYDSCYGQGCSLDIDIFGVGLCEIPQIQKILRGR